MSWIPSWRNCCYGTAIPFLLLHAAALAVFLLPFRRSWLWIAVAFYLLRMFGVTAGYHRYFSHRSYKLARIPQFLLAVLAETSGQKGVLWWAAHHRVHHRHADHDADLHSPGLSGFWWAHVGWILSSKYDDFDPRLVADFAIYPELLWLDRHYLVPPVLLGCLIFVVGGPGAFVWGFLVSTVLVFHATFAINSVAHIWGTRRFATPDQSRNNPLLAVLTLGEGWHNNHHRFMYACSQGLRWWELDITYYVLRLLACFGIVRSLRGIRATELEEARAA